MIAHIDRWVNTGTKKGVLECKTTNAYSLNEWGQEGTDEIPMAYLLQIAHYTLVCDVCIVDLAVLIGGQHFRIYSYHRNKKLEEKLIGIEYDFWHNHVLKKEPPVVKNYRDALSLWPVDDGSAITIADPALRDHITQLHQIKQQMKQLEQTADSVQAHISAAMKEATMLVDYGGSLLATWKMQTSQRFDTTTFKKSHPDLYNQFTKSIPSRVFRLKESKNGYNVTA